ncbi:amidohydrolase family protein [Kineococcus sp. R8]|uniref:amidohydrolase n=1 Tax=Kineococcus siccus TaxID=2696567 RepID=UPI001411C50B|nr:amidohydrolase family protein [Kineococcus siccus]NAZ80546.1 amidohydrolase family protein [Kineococcus siccus]
MVVEGSTIAWIGADEAAGPWTRDGDEVVELDGALVTPAFVDAHVHTTETGLLLTGLDLTAARSGRAVLDAVAAAVRAGATAVLGHGWDDTAWPDGRPTREQLDVAAAGAPVYLSRIDVHSALVSSALAATAGVVGTTGWTPEGWVTLDAHHAARDARWRILGPADRERAQRAALRQAAGVGVGAVHEMSGPHISGSGDLAALVALAGAGADDERAAGREPLPDVVAYRAEAVTSEAAARDAVAAAAADGVRLAGLGGDLNVDGALGSRTARLRADYADAPGHRGTLQLGVAALRDHLHACTRAGVPAGFHAIGDEALDVLCSALEEVEADLGTPAVASAGHRVEHAVAVDAHAIAVLARLGVAASVQPAFDAAWGGADGAYAARLGPERARALHPFAALAAAGVPLALGSDSPVTPLDPWGAVRAAAFHRTPGHATSVRAAFLAHTRGGHRVARTGHPGTLRPGAPASYAVWGAADLVVQAADGRLAAWSTDERSGTPGLPDLTPGTPAPRCLRTVLDGVVLHDRLG